MCSKSDRYLGLPVMLKAGEYSPNNPLIRGERTSGDVLLGLGEYERRRNTLRKIRQRQYKEYLDQQAKIKQEEKEKQEREKREREEKERLEEERERERERRELERESSPERRRASFSNTRVSGANNAYTTKVDTGVQVDRHTPLSVAVQTDDDDLYTLPSKHWLTQAERELSPRTVVEAKLPATWAGDRGGDRRRRSYGDFYERTCSMSKGDKFRNLQQTYKPSILDAEAVSLRNLQAEKEAAARRQYYQQELKNQIQEQQRIREERKNREKMLEQAEMRRLEQQLRSLKMAQERELDRQRDITTSMKYNSADYDSKRTALQRDIDIEQRKLNIARTQTSDTDYIEKPYTMNIPENSIFSQNYDLENYLRKNLNPSKESLLNLPHYKDMYRQENRQEPKSWNDRKLDNSNSVYDNWYERKNLHEDKGRDSYENREDRQQLSREYDGNRQELANRQEYNMKLNLNSQLHENGQTEKFDALPIPVLRHSPKHKPSEISEKYENMSEEMKVVDDKWKIPAVQKNILKNLQSEGRNINILTQLGSIRRQLQLEQMKLDKIRNTDV